MIFSCATTLYFTPFIFFFSFVFVKIESELTKRKPTGPNMTKPNQLNQINQTKLTQTKPNHKLVCF